MNHEGHKDKFHRTHSNSRRMRGLHFQSPAFSLEKLNHNLGRYLCEIN